ncbi:hypothetical protein, partial [Corynebacterium diphtheriae]|uniref:hypothetical protein n=1 Tax=Corynebacterium diphtheriae TaxID=1717 RepID=UPI002109D246
KKKARQRTKILAETDRSNQEAQGHSLKTTVTYSLADLQNSKKKALPSIFRKRRPVKEQRSWPKPIEATKKHKAIL